MKKAVSIMLVLILFASISYAHPGVLDQYGGHSDDVNESGLGGYHYHCGDSPAHLHTDVICPYTGLAVNAASVAPQTPDPEAITVTVNGKAVETPEAPPFVENGRTYVPVRAVLEAFGVDSISWNAPYVIVKKSDVTLRIPVGQNHIERNGSKVAVDSPAMIKESRTCLPIGSVIKALGGTVGWDESTRTVMIMKAIAAVEPAVTTPSVSMSNLKISFIDVGQGESVLLDLDGVDILIDAGDRSGGDKVVSYLKSQGVDDLELVIASHPDVDHIGGMHDVFAAFQVERFLDCGTVFNTDLYRGLMNDVVSEGCQYGSDRNETITYGDLKIEILEMGDNHSAINDDSVIAVVTYKSQKMLFTGDAGFDIEQQLTLNSAIGKVDLFKAGHHGSYSSNSQRLIEVIQPDISVISYGVGNPFGLPDYDSVARLKMYSRQLLTTAGKSIRLTFFGAGTQTLVESMN